MSKRNKTKQKQFDQTVDLEQLLSDEAIVLSGNSSKKVTKQTISNVRKAVEFLKSNGVMQGSDGKKSKIPATGSVPKSKRSAGQQASNASNSDSIYDEETSKDLKAWRDYLSTLSKVYSDLNNSSKGAANQNNVNGSNTSAVMEYQLDSKLGVLSETISTAMMRYFTSIANSKSLMYSSEVKLDAKNMVSTVEALMGGGVESSRVRGLRMSFIPLLLASSVIKFPEIETGLFRSWGEVVELQNTIKLIKRYSSLPKGNDRIKDDFDSRGGLDVNAIVPLPFLPITDKFKEVLAYKGVSPAILAELDNYSLPVISNTNIDEDHEMSSDHFKVEGDLFGSSLHLKRYTGPASLSEFQMELISFIDKFRMKSKAVVSPDTSGRTVDNINQFNPDVAVKLWIMLALNAVYKVMLEDGTGIMDRVTSSQLASTEARTGSTFFDVATEIANVNTNFFSRNFDKINMFLSKKPFRFSASVYKFLKENWAPVVKKYDFSKGFFLGDAKLPGERITVNIIPKLILPCNPYDSLVSWYENVGNVNSTNARFPAYNADNIEFDISGTQRSALFRAMKLDFAYVDPRNGSVFRSTTVRFDNMFSHAMFVIVNARRYNAHSYLATKVDGNEFDYPTFSVAECTGPYVINANQTGAGHAQFRGDMFSSALHRCVKLGITGDDSAPFIIPDQLTGYNSRTKRAFADNVIGGDYDDGLGLLVPYLAYFHTNSIAVRFFYTAYWFASTPLFIARRNEINMEMSRFVDYVLDGDKTLLSTYSQSLTPAALSANGSYMQSLDIADAFRYTPLGSKIDDKLLFVDNTNCDKPVLYYSITGDATTQASNREISALALNIDKMTGIINRASVLKNSQDLKGAFSPFRGIEYNDSNAHRGVVGVKSIGGISVTDLANSDSGLYLHKRKGRLEIDNIGVRPSLYFKEYGGKLVTTYNKPGYPSCFTKQVTTGSFATYHGPATSAQNANIAHSWYSPSHSVHWGDHLCQWNKRNPDLINYGASNREFNLLVKYIFSIFTSIDQSSTLLGIRYSSSIYTVVNERRRSISDESHLSLMDRDSFIIDPYNVTSLAHVIGSGGDADFDATVQMMRLLKQKVLPSLIMPQDSYAKSILSGITCSLNSDYIYIKLRTDNLYKTKLPEIVLDSGVLDDSTMFNR